jgi:hypothetical protein
MAAKSARPSLGKGCTKGNGGSVLVVYTARANFEELPAGRKRLVKLVGGRFDFKPEHQP